MKKKKMPKNQLTGTQQDDVTAGSKRKSPARTLKKKLNVRNLVPNTKFSDAMTGGPQQEDSDDCYS